MNISIKCCSSTRSPLRATPACCTTIFMAALLACPEQVVHSPRVCSRSRTHYQLFISSRSKLEPKNGQLPESDLLPNAGKGATLRNLPGQISVWKRTSKCILSVNSAPGGKTDICNCSKLVRGKSLTTLVVVRGNIG